LHKNTQLGTVFHWGNAYLFNPGSGCKSGATADTLSIKSTTYAIVCGLMCAKRSYRDILIRTTMHNSKSLGWRRIGKQIRLCLAA
jgi:hypothetical protein